MKLIYTVLLYCFVQQLCTAQVAKYWVRFTDKKESPYSVFKAYEFLSARALERRANQGIAVDESDLPVNPHYVEQLIKSGARIHNRSRWMNAATIVADSLTVAKVGQLPFVQDVRYVGKHLTSKRKTKAAQRPEYLEPYEALPEYYGYGTAQIGLMNGELLHQLDFQGAGKMVAVLDGGFTNVDIMPFFDSLRAEGRLIAGYDFADNDATVFESSSHGTQVLSSMASHLPGLLVGTAPAATYVLIKTEDTRGEYLVEECNWVAGAEYADSIGADIINSSLGYTTFNDKSMNYTYADMDGSQSIASRAADIAFSKGILVVNSAGNSGSGPWKYIGAPADARKALTVGATNAIGGLASFSSIGPTADGRIKPNIATMGQNVVVASIKGYDLQLANGTSLASPLAAGMAASLWSAFPEKTNTEIYDVIEESAHLFNQFNDEMGYGIPNFLTAYLKLKAYDAYPDRILNTWVLQDKESGDVELIHFPRNEGQAKLRIRHLASNEIITKFSAQMRAMQMVRLPLPQLEKVKPGLYVLEFMPGERTYYFLLACY